MVLRMNIVSLITLCRRMLPQVYIRHNHYSSSTTRILSCLSNDIIHKSTKVANKPLTPTYLMPNSTFYPQLCFYSTRTNEPKSKENKTPKENIYTIPNLLSVCRICSVPVMGYLITTDQMQLCFCVAFVAAFTDWLDGFIATQFPSQRSAFGSYLDPLADKLMITCLSITLAYVHLLPVWLVVVYVGRDVALMLGSAVIRYRTLDSPKTISKFFSASSVTSEVKPTFLSKVNTTLQLALIGLTIAAPIWQFTDALFLQTLWYGTAFTTIASGLSYAISPKVKKVQKKESGGPKNN